MQLDSARLRYTGESHAAVQDVMGAAAESRKDVPCFSFVPPPHSVCVCVSVSSFSSLLYRQCLHPSLHHCENGSVSHFLCVCIGRNVCVGTVAVVFYRLQEFLRNSLCSKINGFCCSQ